MKSPVPFIRNGIFFINLFTMYFFRKQDPNRPTNFSLKVMHYINALAIIMFIGGILYKLIDWFILSK